MYAHIYMTLSHLLPCPECALWPQIMPNPADIVCCDTQQTCLLCDKADMSAASNNRHVCCVKQQTCLLCRTADMSAM